MAYELMYVVFGVMFVFGGSAYWVVTKIFRDESQTYEPKADEQGTV